MIRSRLEAVIPRKQPGGASAFGLASIQIAALFVCASCFFLPADVPDSDLAADMNALLREASEWAAPAGDTRIAVLGFREDDGQQTPSTEVLDEHLLSALMQSGASVATGVGATVGPRTGAGVKWPKEAVLPAGWDQLEERRLLSGLVRYEAPWAYVRLVLTDREAGEVLGSATRRVSQRQLERAGQKLTARRQKIYGGTGKAGTAKQREPLGVDLHVLVRRDEAGFSKLVELSERGTLKQGDRLQLRFRVDSDCTAYAFLFQSNGEREDVFASAPAYPGRVHYGPAEEGWVTLNQVNEVYTLYFIAGRDLDEDNGELFSDMADLVGQGMLDKFNGIDKLDEVMKEYFDRQIDDDQGGGVQILRGREGIEIGEDKEEFVYRDGAKLESSPELLSAAEILIRAVSFDVQYQ